MLLQKKKKKKNTSKLGVSQPEDSPRFFLRIRFFALSLCFGLIVLPVICLRWL